MCISMSISMSKEQEKEALWVLSHYPNPMISVFSGLIHRAFAVHPCFSVYKNHACISLHSTEPCHFLSLSPPVHQSSLDQPKGMIFPGIARSRSGFPELKEDSLLRLLEAKRPKQVPSYIFCYASSFLMPFFLVFGFLPSFLQGQALRPLFDDALLLSQPRKQGRPRRTGRISW